MTMLKPAPLFGDYCVLAKGRELRVFGQATDRKTVTACLEKDGRLLCEGACEAEQGRFLLLLPPVDEYLTGCTLTIRCDEEIHTAKDVAVGLVFLAGGQSNMELELQNADEGKTLIQTHDDAMVRYFNVPKKAIWDEEAVQAEEWSHWETIRPGSGLDMSAVAYFYAMKLRRELNVPIGIIDCYWGGTSVTAWMDEEALLRTAEGKRYLDEWNQQAGNVTMEQFKQQWKTFQDGCADWDRRAGELRAAHPEYSQQQVNDAMGPYPWYPPVGPGSPYRPGGLCETMVKRVIPVALNGMLFYQGEEDHCRTTCYEQLLVQMVLRWRELFRAMDVPFLNVQLPMWIDANAVDDGRWAALRMAQQKARQMIADSDLCCLIDCGEYNNIHPTDKRTPGERLANLWLQREGRKVPLCQEAVRKYARGGELVVECNALLACPGEEPALFEIAGQDGKYVAAQATIAGSRITLRAEAVPRPMKARYAHVAYGKVNVFGENGEPLCPFVLE